MKPAPFRIEPAGGLITITAGHTPTINIHHPESNYSRYYWVPVIGSSAWLIWANLVAWLPDTDGPTVDINYAQLAEMTEHVVAKTANRSVVGMLNEFSFLGERFLDPGTDLLMLSLRLADVPCGPLYKSTSYPNSEVRLRLLGETPVWVSAKRDRKQSDHRK